jgi:O-antigen ligase
LPEHHLFIPLLCLAAFIWLQSFSLGHLNLTSFGINTSGLGYISADPYESGWAARKLLALIITGSLLIRYTTTSRRFKWLVFVIIGIGIASSVFGLARQTMQGDAPSYVLPSLKPHTAGYAQFINENHFALLIEMSLGLVLGLFLNARRKLDWALVYLTGALLMAATIILSNSRGGVFSMLAELLFLSAVLFVLRHRERQAIEQWSRLRTWGFPLVGALVCGAVLVTAAAGVVWFGGEPLVARMAALSSEVQPVSGDPHSGVRRVEIWQATCRLIKLHPIVGTGVGAFSVAITKQHDATGEWTPEAAHNDYLELVAGGGLIGFGIVCWFAVAFFRLARKRLNSPDPFRRAAGLGALAALFAVATHSLVDFGLHTTVNSIVFVGLIVIATSGHQIEVKRSLDQGLRPETLTPDGMIVANKMEKAPMAHG